MPTCFRLEWKQGKLITTILPPLPLPVSFGCGALVGDTLYVAGGQDSPDATSALKKVFALDLAGAPSKWREIEPWPGPARILAVPASFDGAFWLMGGAELRLGDGGKSARWYLKDAYRYDPGKGWKRVADMPHAVVAAPSPAPATAHGPVILGGDEGTDVKTAPDRHPGFSRHVLHSTIFGRRPLDQGRRNERVTQGTVRRWSCGAQTLGDAQRRSQTGSTLARSVVAPPPLISD